MHIQNTVSLRMAKLPFCAITFNGENVQISNDPISSTPKQRKRGKQNGNIGTPKQNKLERLNSNTRKKVKFSQDCKQFDGDENFDFDKLDAEALVNNSIIIEDEQVSPIPKGTLTNAKRKLSLKSNKETTDTCDRGLITEQSLLSDSRSDLNESSSSLCEIELEPIITSFNSNQTNLSESKVVPKSKRIAHWVKELKLNETDRLELINGQELTNLHNYECLNASFI